MAEELPAFLDFGDPPSVVTVHRTEDAPTRRVASEVPGEPGLWVLILGDLTIFGIFFVTFMVYRRRDSEHFHAASNELLRGVGVTNTVVLLLSSLLVVRAVRCLRGGNPVAARPLLVSALVCAAAFACLKAFEWARLLSTGHAPTQNNFFLMYFVLTGVHLLHVMIGAGLLGYVLRLSRQPGAWDNHRLMIEASAVYWHMVDLLWVVIYALVYLVCVS